MNDELNTGAVLLELTKGVAGMDVKVTEIQNAVKEHMEELRELRHKQKNDTFTLEKFNDRLLKLEKGGIGGWFGENWWRLPAVLTFVGIILEILYAKILK